MSDIQEPSPTGEESATPDDSATTPMPMPYDVAPDEAMDASSQAEDDFGPEPELASRKLVTSARP